MTSSNSADGPGPVTRIPLDQFMRLKGDAVASLRGRVLEIGAGSGANFEHLSPGVDWVGLEPSARFRGRLDARVRASGRRGAGGVAAGGVAAGGGGSTILAAVAEDIPLPDKSVDAVLGTFVFCSVRDTARSLAEIRRVLRPGGELLLVEHVASRAASVRRMQRIASPVSAALSHGCRWDRDPEAPAVAAGFHTERNDRYSVATGIPGLATPCVIYRGVVGG